MCFRLKFFFLTNALLIGALKNPNKFLSVHGFDECSRLLGKVQEDGRAQGIKAKAFCVLLNVTVLDGCDGDDEVQTKLNRETLLRRPALITLETNMLCHWSNSKSISIKDCY